MSLSPEEAAAALDTVHLAGARVKTARRYGEFGPYLITWGIIWLVANIVSDQWPMHGGKAWLAGVIIGTLLTVFFAVSNARRWMRNNPGAGTEGRAIGRRAIMLGITLWVWFPSMMALLGPLSPRQGNAFISITWAFVYMVAGAFIGWRIFAVGLVTAGAVLFGYFALQTHFFLWMGLVGGGSLILGGLWMRRI
jgi:hypothetical protein